MKMAGTQHR